MVIKLMVADDQEVIRTGLAVLLAGKELQIVAEAATGGKAITMTRRHKPDVLLLNVPMSDMDGVDALEQIRENTPATKVLHDLGVRQSQLRGSGRSLGRRGFSAQAHPGRSVHCRH